MLRGTLYTIDDIKEVTSNFKNILTYDAKLSLPCYDITIRLRDKTWFNSENRRLMRI